VRIEQGDSEALHKTHLAGEGVFASIAGAQAPEQARAHSSQFRGEVEGRFSISWGLFLINSTSGLPKSDMPLKNPLFHFVT
jgi:hypothetical protein